jgi:hypothetical protein
MKYKLATAGVVAVALVLSTVSVAGVGRRPADAAAATWALDNYDDVLPADNVILKWNHQLLETIKANPAGTGPVVTARALGVLHTATFDAWAAYDPVAKGTRLGSGLRRPSTEFTNANKSKAISFAAYKTLSWLFPARESTYRGLLAELYPGYATDTSTPRTVGNTAAQAVIDYRNTDGSNQSGGYVDPRSDSDPAKYKPVNTWNNVTDPWRWQPLCVLTPAGVAAGKPAIRDPSLSCPDTTPPTYYALQRPLSPHWGNVKPFSAAPSTYGVYGPPRKADGTFQTADIDRALAETGTLDDRKKSLPQH